MEPKAGVSATDACGGRRRTALAARLPAALLALAAVAPTASAVGQESRDESKWLSRGAVVARVEVADAATAGRLAEDLDVWSWRLDRGYLLVLVSSERYRQLRLEGFAVTVDDTQSDAFWRPVAAVPGQVSGIAGFPCYRTVEETYERLSHLADDHPGLATWTDIGDSWERLHGPGPGYDLFALRLTNDTSPYPKAKLLVDAAIHAREYATAELATRFAELLAAGFGTDPEISWILDHTEVHIIPFLNPDGRKRAEAGELWRKNVDDLYCTGEPLRGVDLNRNNTYFFGGNGSSGDECSLIFRGPEPLSEPETQALFTYMGQIFEDQRGPGLADPAPETATGMYVTLHSFGEVLFPPGWGTGNAPNADQLTTLGRKLGYLAGYAACPAGPDSASGLTHQMAYGEFGVGSVLFELGTTFFQDCDHFESQIVPRNLRALLYAAKAARRPFDEPRGPDVRDVRLSSTRVNRGEPIAVAAVVDDGGYARSGCGEEPSHDVSLGFATVDRPRWELRVARALRRSSGNGRTVSVAGTIDTSRLAPGRHILFVYGRDVEGEVGVGTAAFFEVLDSVGGAASPPVREPERPTSPRPRRPQREPG